MKYLINDIYPTLQGEGVLTGTPMILLRLQGCDVGCPWCDTKETWEKQPQNQVNSIDKAKQSKMAYTEAHESEITFYIKKNHPSIKWVLLTGGEPAEQELKPLVEALHDAGLKIALETSGTALGHLGTSIDWVCISPKIDMSGGKLVLPEALKPADEIKMVIGKPADLAKLDTLLQANQLKETVTICLQPVSQSPKATKLCLETVMERGWRLSIQTHKYLNLP